MSITQQQTQRSPNEFDQSPAKRSRPLCRYLREQREKVRTQDRMKLLRGLDWMVYGSFLKSRKTLFNRPETLASSCELPGAHHPGTT